MDDPDGQQDLAVANLAFELGVLKRIRRAGWWHVGVRDPESVAEHSLRVAQLASLIAAIEGAEPARAALLAVWRPRGCDVDLSQTSRRSPRRSGPAFSITCW